MARRNAILAAVLLLQLVWLGVRAFQAPPPPASAARGMLLAELVPTEVLRLEIGSGSDEEQWVVVEREGEASTWNVPDLFDYPADSDKVDGALRELAGLEIARVVSSTAHHHVDFKVAESEFERRIRLEVAGETVDAVRGYSSWRFGERAEDWIDKVYFSAPRERIAHVAITVVDDQAEETTSFSLERAGEESWFLLGAGDARSPAERDKVDSLLRAMSRVLLSELIGRIDDEDVAFGDPAAEIRLGLAAPRAELEPGDTDELDAGEKGDADTSEFEIEETLTLRVALAPGESERYWLHAEGSEFVAEVARWTIRELLEAEVEDFQAVETDETPEIGKADDTDDSDETDNTREDDAEGEASHRDGGEAG
ncbi:MAG: hypothetical protein JRS35_18160 [Deltaproteobacteria bacterium]|nr:hypothetical protein [Deltaproteobacteria bacterium]